MIAFPKILSYSHPGYCFWVSDLFFDMRNIKDSSYWPYESLNDCLDLAEKKGLVKRYVIPHKLESYDHFSRFGFSKIYDWDAVTYKFKEELAKSYPQDQIYIVGGAPGSGDILLPVRRLYKKIIESNALQDPELAELTKRTGREKWIIPISIVAVAITFLTAPALLVNLFQYIRRSTFLSIVVVLLVLASIRFLYRLKKNNSVQYGVIELVISLCTIGRSLFNFLFTEKSISAIDYLALFSGIYVAIRGLTNIESGLEKKDLTRWLVWWKKFF